MGGRFSLCSVTTIRLVESTKPASESGFHATVNQVSFRRTASTSSHFEACRSRDVNKIPARIDHIMFGGFGGFGRHVPSSDPPIPPKDECLACGKKQDEENKLLRCSASKMAHFCSRECQATAWKGKGKSPDKHKLVCPELAS